MTNDRRWEFPVTDAQGKQRLLSVAVVQGAVRVSSPTTWRVDAPTYREIRAAWSEACDIADQQNGVRSS